jgi:hypothetical protein
MGCSVTSAALSGEKQKSIKFSAVALTFKYSGK